MKIVTVKVAVANFTTAEDVSHAVLTLRAKFGSRGCNPKILDTEIGPENDPSLAGSEKGTS